jgi:Protein of unknown function (DUF4235)
MADDNGDDGHHSDGGKAGYKAMASLAAVVAAMLARKSLAVAWKTATGKAPPANPEHPGVGWTEAVSWAVVSGAVVGLARLLAQKKVAARYDAAARHVAAARSDTARRARA